MEAQGKQNVDGREGHFLYASDRVRRLAKSYRKKVGKLNAELWHHIYRAQYSALIFRTRHAGWVASGVLFFLFWISLHFAPSIQLSLESHYASEIALEGLRALLLNIGGPLIGATAIVSSLVMFAMQVNIERMPHGLFRRLSSDRKLLAAFAAAFLIAIGVAALSSFVTRPNLAYVVLAAGWGVILVLCLFLYSFKRALSLISPTQQLNMVMRSAVNELQAWMRRADRAWALLERDDENKESPSTFDSTHDVARTAYFKLNPHWTQGANQAVRYAMSFARRYAEQGDYEISGIALNLVVSINAAYIQAKGKTFYTTHLLVENPLTTDGFINDSLEHLRQHAHAAIARRDEKQIEQTLQAMAALVRIYLRIDYSSPLANKTHAHLAAGYLSAAVESIVPHNMADVLLEGLRLMGKSALHFLAFGKPDDIATLSEKIALIACTGSARETYRPVTMEGMQQLADITFDLIRSLGKRDIRFAAGEVRKDVALVANLFLAIKDTPLFSTHSTFLGPYYSSTSQNGLRHRLTTLANALSEAKADDENAQTVIRNIEHWAEDMYQTEKELLLKAIGTKSHFTFDMIHWITGITELLLAVSNAAACKPHYKEKLQKHAQWLLATLTWVPDDKDTVVFLENFQMTEALFDAAFDAHNRGSYEFAADAGDYLLSWVFKGGKYQTGWGILETGLSGAAVFALARGDAAVDTLKTKVTSLLAKADSPVQELRDSAARGLRETAETLSKHGYPTRHIEIAMQQSDHTKLRPLLHDLADMLSPGTKDEPINVGVI